jgi:hypothetical protein
MSTVQGGQGNIVTNGLVLNLDAANPRSYPQPYNGTDWQNLVPVSGSISGSLVNGVGYTGSNGGALTFDGVDDYVDCGNPTSLQITGSLTLSTWIKASTSSNNGSLFCKSIQIFGDPGQKIYELGYLSNIMYFQIGDNASNTVTLSYTSTPVITNTWHQVIASWDGTTNTNGLKLYYDGLLVAQTTSTISSIQNLAYSLIMGYGRRTPFLYVGSMAVAQVYNRALNASEVLQNFNATRARFGV